MRTLAYLVAAGAVVGSLAAPTAARAAFMSEYFDGYGASTVRLVNAANSTGLSGGTGWGGPWARVGTLYGADLDYVTYVPNVQLTSTVPGYVNGGGSGTDLDGALTNPTTANASANRITTRATGGLTGTVWMSMLFKLTAAFYKNDLTLDSSNSGSSIGAHLLAIQSGNGGNPTLTFGYGGTDAAPVNTTLADSVKHINTNVTNLLLIKIDMNADAGGSDNVSIWLNPTTVTSEAAMGAANLAVTGVDAYGPTFDYIGLGMYKGYMTADALRVSNDDTAFLEVTTGAIPEPGVLSLLGVGAMGALLRRKSRA